MPESTEEEIEEEVASLIMMIVTWKKRNDRPGAEWKVGTTRDVDKILESHPPRTVIGGWSSWKQGSPQRAAREIAEYHGMKIEGTTKRDDTHIYTFSDRLPTIDEIRQREKEPLTVKQKTVFRIIRRYFDGNGQGPTKTEVRRITGHRNTTTTKQSLDILERKNWIIVGERSQRIKLI